MLALICIGECACKWKRGLGTEGTDRLATQYQGILAGGKKLAVVLEPLLHLLLHLHISSLHYTAHLRTLSKPPCQVRQA